MFIDLERQQISQCLFYIRPKHLYSFVFFLPHFLVIVQENLTQEPNRYLKHIFLQCLPPHSPITKVILGPPNQKKEKEVRSLGHRAQYYLDLFGVFW